jgi:hypothetical protein
VGLEARPRRHEVAKDDALVPAGQVISARSPLERGSREGGPPEEDFESAVRNRCDGRQRPAVGEEMDLL